MLLVEVAILATALCRDVPEMDTVSQVSVDTLPGQGSPVLPNTYIRYWRISRVQSTIEILGFIQHSCHHGYSTNSAV